MATVLSIIQKVCLERLGKVAPDIIYSSSGRMEQELGSIANTIAELAVEEYDWKVIKRLETITGDGVTTSFALPTGYVRMLKKANLWSDSYTQALTHIVDTDRWEEIRVRGDQVTYGAWTLIGDNVHITPAPANLENITYYYIKNHPVLSDGGGGKTTFTLDTDTFRLGDKLLFHGIAWKYREAKGLPYAEDLNNYETTKERLIAADGGSKVLRFGTPSMPRDATIAYPYQIVG